MANRASPNQRSHSVLGGVVERGVVAVLLAVGAVGVEGFAEFGMAFAELQGGVLLAALELLAKLGGHSAHGEEERDPSTTT